MEVVAAIVGSLVTEVARCTISPIIKHTPIKYLFNLGNNVQSLNEEVSKLTAKRGSIQDGVDAAKRNGETIESNVDNWLTEVNEKITVVVEIIQSYEQQAKQKCFVGLCPNLKARYKFSRQIEEEAKAVANLLKNGNFSRIAYLPPIQEIITFSNKDFEAFESRTGIFNGIMDALKDDSISIIGVHGMGGVGKTTLVREVARQVKESNLFHSVVFVGVTQTPDVKDIQNKMMESLGLRCHEQGIEARAVRLQQKLKNEKILVVLDDIWKKFNLDEVGIPTRDAQGELKILLTSRDRDVLSNGMASQNNFPIGLLTEEEAWDLFKKMAGDCVQSRDLQPIAIEVARKCARLPIAIATVARALRNKKSSREWENALRELKRPSPKSFTGATTGEVYSAIQFSYEYLQTEEDKLTFLLCSLIGHNGSIEDLLRYTMGLGLYDGINKINEGRNKVFSVVNTLKASCLLLDSYDDEHFDIHDVVWDVSISIATRDHGMLVQHENDDVLKKLRSKEILQNCKMIALRHLDIRTELPDELECPHLLFFFMDHQGSLKIPGDFFTQTERLKVLRLTRMLLPTLPVSIGLLHNLQTLCLDGCTLKDIMVVGELKNLEILTLARSNIEVLPKEIAQLTRLKLLDLNHCSKLKIIPPNILSCLFELEELYMEDNSSSLSSLFDGWEDEVVGNERRNASLEEIKVLSHLTTLYADIPDGQKIPEWLLEKNLDRYRIFNGYNWMDRFSKSEYSKMLKLQLYTNISSSCAMKMLVKNTELLFLEPHKGVKNVLDKLNIGKDFPYLKKLYIQKGSDVEFISTEKIEFSQLEFMKLKDLPRLMGFCYEQNTSQQGEEGTISKALPLFNKQSTFPHLEELELCDINIRRIWQRQLPETSYHPLLLTRLIIEDCDNLEHLLSPSVARCLVKLKDFEIRRCKCLREIISKHEMEIQEDEQKVVICFPDLNSFKIDYLQNLIEFCSEICIIELPSLKVLKIQGCPKLQEFISTEPKMQALFSQKVAIPNLERKQGEGTSSEALPLFNKQLTTMKIGGCKAMTEIVAKEGGDEDGSTSIIFSKLKTIHLYDLQSLTSFCGSLNYTLEFPSLEECIVGRCPSMKVFCQGVLSTPCLHTVKKSMYNNKGHWGGDLNTTIQQMYAEKFRDRDVYQLKLSDKSPELMEMWNGMNSQQYFNFSNLYHIELYGCNSLKHGFTSSIALNLNNLWRLEIKECIHMEHVIWDGRHEVEETTYNDIMFSKLETLKIESCANLQSFYLGSDVQQFPNIETMEIKDCQKMMRFISNEKKMRDVNGGSGSKEKPHHVNLNIEAFFHHKVECPQLQTLELSSLNIHNIWSDQLQPPSLVLLEVESCHNLKYLFPYLMVREFVKLKYLEIRDCERLEEVISMEGLKEEESISFPALEKLTLKQLPKLTRFCSQNNLEVDKSVFFNEKVIFPSLEELKVNGIGDFRNIWPEQLSVHSFCELKDIEIESCAMLLNIFPFKMMERLTRLEKLQIVNCGSVEEIFDSQAFLNQKVAFPSLQRMILSNTRNVKTIFHNELLEGSFCKLEEMTVEDCDELLTVFPSNISFRVFQNLKKLKVISCDSLEIIFEIGEETSVVKSQLIDLSIVSAPKLKHIWARDPQAILIFQSLSKVEVWGCENLKNVFPASIAKNLPQFENLSIGRCGVEEIVWEGEELNLEEQPLPVTFNFPRLSNLELRFLEQLKCFYGSWGKLKHRVVLEWPMLKSLDIDYSTLQKIEASQHQQTNEEAQSMQSLSHPFSFLQQVIPKLEELCLSDVKDVECGSSLQRFYSLESLQLYECDFKDVGVVDTGTLSRIQNLELSWCLNLKQLGLNFGFSATSSSSCFQNLTTLEVYMCEVMVNLITASVAQNLVQLTTMNIACCIAMTEIVENEGDEDGSTSIIFSKLKSLDLCDLPSLTSFCSGDYTFNFPSLEELTIGGCPNLKLFCHGALGTPILKMVKWKFDGEEEDWVADKVQWTGDLNSTIKQMYAEKVGYGDLQILKLSEKFLELMEIWNGRNPQQYFYFMTLAIIELCECSSFKYGFTSSVAFNLNNLWRLEVKKCINIKQVIWDERDEVKETTYKNGMFSKLEILKIESCANLQSFYLGSGVLQFSKLETIKIFDCPKMMRFISTEEKISGTNHECHDRSGTGKMLHQGDLKIKPFFNKKVVLPSLEELEINGIRDCRKIWTEQLSLYSFCKLKKVEIESCAMLLSIFPFNMMERLARMEKLQIVNCHSLEEIFELEAIVTTQTIVTETVTKFMFPRVTYLRFDELPNLKSFYSRKHTTEWPSLKTMEVSDCPKVEIFSSECQSIGEIQGQSQTDISNVQQPLFQVNEVTFPILEELRLKQNDTMKGTWFEQLLPTVCFKNLKVIELSCIPDKLTALSYCFIKALPDLEKLTLSEAPFCEIFQSEEVDDNERPASTFSRLIELKLSKLPELTHLWEDQFQPTPVLCNLNILEVLDCGKLKTLVPCWISFRNLRKLKVSGCDGVMNLIACSAAKSLMFLTEMSISDCKMIKEIIACECDDKGGSIIFSNLNCLQLSNLPSLSSFCLGNHSFEFPALLNLIVRECPTMEHFCPGDLNAPKLKKLSLTADEARWEGDLKTTIKHLFREMNVQISEVTEATL